MSNRWAKAQDLGMMLGTPPLAGLPAWAIEPERYEIGYRWPPKVSQAAFDFECAAIMRGAQGLPVEHLRVQRKVWWSFKRREAFRLELYAADPNCHWCRERMDAVYKDHDRYASFEHLIPRRLGGRFTRDNIVLAHAGCNRKRENKNHLPRYAHDPMRQMAEA